MERMHQSDGRIHLLVLDVDLPGASGLQCRTEARRKHPTLPILLITGSPGVVFDDDEDEHCMLLRKPFKMSELAFLAGRLLAGPEAETG
jgi:DNA-binding response OmpR family regulator